MSSSDEALIGALREGQPGAWERLIERYGRLALSIPLRMGLPESDAEEVCQATWVILHRHLGWIEKPGSLAAWIATTAGREAVKLRRLKRRYQPLEGGGDLVDVALLPRDRLDRMERLQIVHDLVEAMPDPCKRLLQKLYFDPQEPPYVDIARALDIPIGSIGPMRGRCLARLARQLQSPERHLRPRWRDVGTPASTTAGGPPGEGGGA